MLLPLSSTDKIYVFSILIKKRKGFSQQILYVGIVTDSYLESIQTRNPS
jgi:hypothetical protein